MDALHRPGSRCRRPRRLHARGGASTITYADGDEVRIPSGASTRFVVVWVEKVDVGTPREFKRAYLLRNTA